ncbi:MAG: AAA family ATPase [Thermoprotei archaeon]
MSKPLVVCTAGLKGSGKSVLSEAAGELGYQVVSLGEVMRRELAKRMGDVTHANMKSFTVEIRREMGSAAVAILSAAQVNPDAQKVVFDGLRSMDEYLFFKERFGRCVLIAVHASPKTRFKRLTERSKPDDPKTLEEFEQRDQTELALGLGNLMVLADYHLVNEGLSHAEFKKECLDLLKALCNANTVEPHHVDPSAKLPDVRFQ